MSYPRIDASQLKVFPLSERRNLLDIEQLALDPAQVSMAELSPTLQQQVYTLADRILAARAKSASVIMVYGAHLVKNGATPLVNALIEEGYLTHLATQGAGVIHDWEFAFQAASGESVRDNAPVGRFGSWEETGYWLNLAVLAGAAEGLGFGEAVGKMVEEDHLLLPTMEELLQYITSNPREELTAAKADLLRAMEQSSIPSGRLEVAHPYKRYSILAQAYRHRIPMTIHPGIGYDIIVNHPLYHGGAIGRASATDTRVLTHAVDRLDHGVFVSIGSAIMSPQVFEKAFSAANNLRASQGRPFLRDHYLAIVDIQDGGGWDWSTGEPPPDSPSYYLRYCKSFCRMGGTLDYLRCDNRLFLAGLLSALREKGK